VNSNPTGNAALKERNLRTPGGVCELKAHRKNSPERARSANTGRIPVNSMLTGKTALKGRNLPTQGESL